MSVETTSNHPDGCASAPVTGSPQRKKRRKNVAWRLTPFGSLVSLVGESMARAVMDKLELHARQQCKDGIPAIIFDGTSGTFATVENAGNN